MARESAPLRKLREHVTGRIEAGDAEAITEITADQLTIATMTTALELALDALTVTANESANGTRTQAAIRAKAKRAIRVALGKAAFDGPTR